MEKEKYNRAVEIARELDALQVIIEEFKNQDYTTTLRVCQRWNPQTVSGKWEPCDNMDCISDILARHTVLVLHEIQNRRNELHKEIEEL